jgi:hypothetical protein
VKRHQNLVVVCLLGALLVLVGYFASSTLANTIDDHEVTSCSCIFGCEAKSFRGIPEDDPMLYDQDYFIYNLAEGLEPFSGHHSIPSMEVWLHVLEWHGEHGTPYFIDCLPESFIYLLHGE